jgi:predicted nucleotidyltransferase
MRKIHLLYSELETVKHILDAHVPELEALAFGSRITMTSLPVSDLDLVLMSQEPLPSLKMADIKEAFSESDLPFKVDITDWASVGQNFRKIISAQAVALNELECIT